MSINTQRVQIAASAGESPFVDVNTFTAANIVSEVDRDSITPTGAPTFQTTQDNVADGYFGNRVSIVGSSFSELGFTVKMVGLAMDDQPLRRLLLANGYALSTKTAGATATGNITTVEDAKNTGSLPTAPQFTSPSTAYTGTFSGILCAEIVSIVLDTSVTFSFTAIYTDVVSVGTMPANKAITTGSATDLDSGTVLGNLSLTIDNPGAGTAGYAVGDKFYCTVQSSAFLAQTIFTPINTGFATVNLGKIEETRAFRIGQALSNLTITGNRGEPIKLAMAFRGTDDGRVDQSVLTSVPWADNEVFPALGQNLEYDGTEAECWTTFTFDKGNTVELIECAKETNGYDGAVIINENPTFTLDPLAVSTWASYDPYTIMEAMETNFFRFRFFAADVGTGKQVYLEARNAAIRSISESARQERVVDNHVWEFDKPRYDGMNDYTTHRIIIQ